MSQPVVVYTSVAWPRGKGSPAVYGLWFGPDDARNQARWTNNVVQSQNKVCFSIIGGGLKGKVF